MAPGAEQDAALHKGHEIPTEMLLSESCQPVRRPVANDGKPVLSAKVVPKPEQSARKVSSSSLSVEASSAVDETAFANAEEDDEIEIVTVRGPTV
jgi:hypothetical protein